MKTYRLVSWPDLGPEFQRTAFRRALSELSMRDVGIDRLTAASGLKRPELMGLLEHLASLDLLVESDDDAVETSPATWLDRLKRSAAASPWR